MKSLLRVLLKAFTLVLLLLFLSYALVYLIPGDPVSRLISANDPLQSSDALSKRERYIRMHHQLGMDLPPFYFSVSTLAVPDSLHYLPLVSDRDRLIYWSAFSGDALLAYQWCNATGRLLDRCKKDTADNTIMSWCLKLHASVSSEEVIEALSRIRSSDAGAYKSSELNHLFDSMEASASEHGWRRWWPVLNWNPDNRFHRLLFGVADDPEGGLLNGNLGRSWSRGEQVEKLILFPILLTVSISLFCVLVILLVSVPLGSALAMKKKGVLHSVFFSVSLFIFSVPTFWLGIIVVIFFCSPYYLGWFPVVPPQLDQSSVARWSVSLLNQAFYFVLPVLIISSSGIAYLTKMTYELVCDELRKPYALAVLARGVSFRRLVFRHILRNIAVPLLVSALTVFASFLGSTVVMDYLFSIPGSGQLLMQACTEADYPVVQGLVLGSGIFVLFSFVCSDLLTLLVDPRVSSERLVQNVEE